MVGVDPAGKALGLQRHLAADPVQQGRIGRGDGGGGQAVDTGAGEVDTGDVDHAPDRAVPRPGLDGDAAGLVAVEADDEDAVGRGGGQGLAVDEDQGPGPGGANGVAALDEITGQAQRVLPPGQRRAGGQGGRGTGQQAATTGVHGLATMRVRASSGLK